MAKYPPQTIDHTRLAKKAIIFIVGPTAIGKSDIALSLAKQINAEIISCDSMQIYKGMDIITSKPTLSQRKKVQHHLLDIVKPNSEYNVSLFRTQALKKIKQVHKIKKIPLLVGGTGLYMTVLVDGIFKDQANDEAIRSRLFQQANLLGRQYLYERLQNVDPAAAQKIHPHDLKRIIRALEVYQITGKPISVLQKTRKGLSQDYNLFMFCLNMERVLLYQRIDERVEKMFRQGLVAEVKRLLGFSLGRTAGYAIGIKEVKGYLQGSYDLAESKRLMQRNTRLYAKRQLTWFRKDKRIIWVDVAAEEQPSIVARRIARIITSKGNCRCH